MITTREVWSRVAWSIAGGGAAAALLFAGTVIAGRMLGPADYGQVAFATALAQLLSILAIHGMDLSASRALATAADGGVRASIVSTSIVSVLISSSALLLLGLITSGLLATAFGANRTSVQGGFLLVGLFALKSTFDRHLGALGMVTFQARAKPIEGMVVIGGLALLDLNDQAKASSVICLLGTAGTVLLGVYSWRLRSHLSRRWIRWKMHQSLSSYGQVILAGALAPLPLWYADKVAVQHALGPENLGIYMAYFTSTALVATQLLMVTNNVLFPIVVGSPDKRRVLRNIKRASAFGLVPFTAAIAVFSLAVLRLFGDRYPVEPRLVLAFSCLAALQFRNGLAQMVVMAHSRKALATEVRWTALRSTGFLVYLWTLAQTGNMSLLSVVAGLIGCEALGAMVLTCIGRRALGSAGLPRQAAAQGPRII